MISSYTTKRKTNRWPNIVFANILDISALNAYIIFSDIDDSVRHGDQKRKRPEFLKNLALSLAYSFMMKRTPQPYQQFSADLLEKLRAPPTDVCTSSAGSVAGTRKRGFCLCCKAKSDKMPFL